MAKTATGFIVALVVSGYQDARRLRFIREAAELHARREVAMFVTKRQPRESCDPTTLQPLRDQPAADGCNARRHS